MVAGFALNLRVEFGDRPSGREKLREVVAGVSTLFGLNAAKVKTPSRVEKARFRCLWSRQHLASNLLGGLLNCHFARARVFWLYFFFSSLLSSRRYMAVAGVTWRYMVLFGVTWRYIVEIGSELTDPLIAVFVSFSFRLSLVPCRYTALSVDQAAIRHRVEYFLA